MAKTYKYDLIDKKLTKAEREEGTVFAPSFNTDGLITAVAVHADTKEVLMVAWMNSDALKRTIDSGEAWYWSRSRDAMWHKGGTSGQIQKIIQIRTDCDQDVLQLLVIPEKEGACHVGYRSCFYRSVQSNDGNVTLKFEESEKVKND